MPNILIQITTDPISERHISWFTTEESDGKIALHEVVERKYLHPQSPGITLSVVETEIHKMFLRTDDNGAVCVLLEAAQKAISLLTKVT